MKKTVFTLALILLAVSLGAQGSMDQYLEPDPGTAPDTVPDIDDPVGREVARYGQMGTLQGKLLYDGDEWHLVTDEIIYEMHMGPAGHDTDDLFEQDSPAEVQGFIYRDHIAPVRINSTTGTVGFWDEGRFPLWAGVGQRIQQADERGLLGTAAPYQQQVIEQGERGNPLPHRQETQQHLLQREEELVPPAYGAAAHL